MTNQLSPFLDILRWLQLLEAILFPIALVILGYLAWRDFRRLVNFRIKEREGDEADAALAEEVKKFGE